jgi:hypothetical protein
MSRGIFDRTALVVVGLITAAAIAVPVLNLAVPPGSPFHVSITSCRSSANISASRCSRSRST